jgi:AcrR family transcriptional regulator
MAAEARPLDAVTRVDRRKARTRAALVAAAQKLLSEGKVDASIQQITELADVGFGSFYNHFTDKAELWEAAILEALHLHAELVAAASAGIEDPAEVFCVGVRLTGRLQRAMPQLARVLINFGLQHLLAAEGMAAHAREDLQAAIDSGRFDVTDVDLALVLTGGALLGLVTLLDSDPGLDADRLADETATRVLRSLGLTKAEASRLAARPLPEIGPLPGASSN